MKNKGESVSNIIFGIIFLAVGGLLLYMRSETSVVNVIAIADLLLGVVLFIAGIVGLRKKTEKYESDVQESAGQDIWTVPEPQVSREAAFDEPEAEVPERRQPSADSVEALSAREAELRRLVKQRRAEARQAAAEAEEASARASEAEQRLVQAENEIKHLSGAEQGQALARIDRMADEAMELSQRAAFAARKAKMADRALKEATEQHNLAMDAAADAMLAAEEAALNN